MTAIEARTERNCRLANQSCQLGDLKADTRHQPHTLHSNQSRSPERLPDWISKSRDSEALQCGPRSLASNHRLAPDTGQQGLLFER